VKAIRLVSCTVVACASPPAQFYAIDHDHSHKALPLGEVAVDCDARAGHLSGWSRGIASTGLVTGTLYYERTRVDKNSLPDAVVAVGTTDRHGGEAGFSATFLQSKPEALVVRRISNVGKADDPILKLAANADVHFTLKWGAGDAAFRVEPETAWVPVPMQFTPERLWLGCATAKVTYDGLTITSPAP
jgi:hypothetical protein